MMSQRWRGALAIGLAAVSVGACGDARAPSSAAGVEAKTDVTKTDVAKTDVTKTDVAKPDVAKTDVAKTDAVDDPTPPALPQPTVPSRLGVAPDPDHAVVITKDGIVALDGSGARLGTLVAGRTRWCRVDARAGVLWYQQGKDDQSAELGLFTSPAPLSFLDLAGDGPPVTVLETSPETVVIEYPDEVLGRPESHEFEDGVVLHMETTPRVEAILGCDGDLSYYCFGDEVEDVEAERAKRLAGAREKLKKQPFVGAAALATLVERSKGRRAIPLDPARGPEPTTLASVPRDGCTEAPEDCGTAKRLAGTAFWQVVVENSRGDFFHETVQLYDPAEKMFFDAADPKARSPRPLESEPAIPTWVSPSGTLATDGHVLVKLSGGTLATDLEGVCGFWGGGWENPGR